MSPAKVREHPRLGKCYRCSQPFGPLHVCLKPSLNVLMAGEDSAGEGDANEMLWGELHDQLDDIEQEQQENEVELQHLRLSKLSSSGFDGPQTMKLIGRIADYKVLGPDYD